MAKKQAIDHMLERAEALARQASALRDECLRLKASRIERLVGDGLRIVRILDPEDIFYRVLPDMLSLELALYENRSCGMPELDYGDVDHRVLLAADAQDGGYPVYLVGDLDAGVWTVYSAGYGTQYEFRAKHWSLSDAVGEALADLRECGRITECQWLEQRRQCCARMDDWRRTHAKEDD